MNANERIPDAMADFDSLVRSGCSVDDAVHQSADNNDLKIEIVRFRAEKAFGELEGYRAKCLETIHLNAERRAQLQPLADFIDSIYAKGVQLPFIPIGNYVRANFREGHARDEAFAFSREHEKRLRD